MPSRIWGGAKGASDRRKGNQCRDARDWRGAAEAYTRHLAAHPDDQPIWVQLGHAWKEQGLLAEAADAYQAAVDRAPGDRDANIHLADVLRRLGRGDEALAAYQRVNAVAPSTEALHHIRLLRRDTRATRALSLGDGTVFFAIQDLFAYLKVHVTMSGIQRVQAGIALHAIRDAEVDVRFILSHAGVEARTLPPGEFWMIENDQVRQIIDYASSPAVDHETLRAMLLACEDSAERVHPGRGSTIILLGAFWGLGTSIQYLARSKRDGVRLGAYVYDIIPVTHPEFCDEGLVTDFSMAICELCATADFLLTISDATRHAVAAFIAENGGRAIPMETVPLAHHLTREAGHDVPWPAQLQRVKGKRYVAYVSTIEGRKNHLYVVNAWRRLIAEGVDVPDLVFVGRHGWKIGALTDVLKATDNLGGRLHIAHNLSDGELNAVYAGCDFSVFTSFVEGWGLPVGESLFHGRPCVASNTSSIPEVGGDLVDYVDPFNLTDGVEVLRRMITDRAYLRERTQRVRDRFVARTWRDVGADFLEKVKRHRDAPVRPFDVRLREGQGFSFQLFSGDRVDTRRYFHQLNRLQVDSDSLYAAESHGIWLRGPSPAIAIATEMPPGTAVLLYLRFSVSPGALDCRLKVFDQVAEATTISIGLSDLDRGGGAIRLNARTDDDGVLRLRFDVSGTYSLFTDDARDFAVGLRAMGYARADNLAGRQELLEAMTLRDLAA